MPSWQLADADQIAADNPYTFYKPTRELIQRIAPGETVKLIFRIESPQPRAPGAELLEVRVDAVHATGQYTGQLALGSAWLADLPVGAPVAFDASHIVSCAHDVADPQLLSYARQCYVTRRLLNDGQRVGYLYREAPDAPNDSGWRFTANDESEAYMADPNNSARVSLGVLLSHDNSCLGLLDADEGSAFARDDQTGDFVALDDDGR
jgi:hypothetical protein